jgi:AcrR family transcriptional regulator
MTRKAFQRLSQDVRRGKLIEATLACVARHGLHGATVRAVTEEAGVTVGLVRHYFGGKDEMLREAYRYLVGQLTAEAADSANRGEGEGEGAGEPEAAARLALFLRANITPPNRSEAKVSLWATFIGQVFHDPWFAEIHRDGYRDFLELLEVLVAPVLALHDRPRDPATLRRHAIALNGLIDGLWIEGSLNTGLHGPTSLPDLLVEASERLLGLPPGALSACRDSKDPCQEPAKDEPCVTRRSPTVSPP